MTDAKEQPKKDERVELDDGTADRAVEVDTEAEPASDQQEPSEED